MAKGLWINKNTFVAFSEKTIKSLSDEIATRDRSIDFYSLGMYLPNPDPVLKKMGKDIKVYTELMADGHLGGCITSRKSGVKSLEWEIDRGKAKSRQAKFITDIFDDLPVKDIIGEMMNAPLFGYQPLEIIWKRVVSAIVPGRITGKPQHWFVFDENNEIKLLTKQNMTTGEQLPPKKFLLARNEATYENPYGRPALASCFWPVTFKKGGFKFWVVFAEKYGMPFLWGKLPRGMDQKEYDKLADILENMVKDAIAVTPDDASVEMLTTEGRASGDIYDKLIEACKAEISIAILGQNLTTEVKGGSYAASQSHMQVRKDIRDDDKGIVEDTMNTLIRWIAEYNFSERVTLPKFIMYEEEDVDKTLAERDELLARAGVTLTAQYYQREYGFQEGDIAEINTPPSSPLNLKGEQRGVTFSERGGGHHDFAQPDEWVGEYLDRIAPMLQGAREKALDDLEKWLRSLDTPPSEGVFMHKLQEVLGKAYDNLDKVTVSKTVKEMYAFYKLTDLLSPGLDIALGGADMRTMEFLSDLDSFYLSKFIRNPDVVSQLNEMIKNLYSEEGMGLFGRGEEGIRELKNFLSQKLIDLTNAQVQRIVDTAVQRARNWAHISQLNDSGITELVIYEPTKDCPFCAAIDGTVIGVEKSYNHMLDVLKMSPQEYDAYLKDDTNKPAIQNMESIVDRGMLPPYHPHCHGRIIKRTR